MATFCILCSYMTATAMDILTYGTILPMHKISDTQMWITFSKCYYSSNTFWFYNSWKLCKFYVWHRMCIKGDIEGRVDVHNWSQSHSTTGLWITNKDRLLRNDRCSAFSDCVDVWPSAVATPRCLRSGILSKFNGGGSLGFTWVWEVLNVDL